MLHPLGKICHGDWFPSVCVLGVIMEEHPVQILKDVTEHLTTIYCESLDDRDKVIQVDVYLC